MGRYEAALQFAQGESEVPPLIMIMFAACHAMLEKPEEARRWTSAARLGSPAGCDLDSYAKAYISVLELPEDGQRMREGFRKAGLAV